MYHHSYITHWLIFFKCFTQSIISQKWIRSNNEHENKIQNFIEEARSTYMQIAYLQYIFNYIDGIIEDDDTIYLIVDDISFIETTINKWKI